MLSALAARLRDLTLAEDCFAHACAAAAATWGATPPRDPAAWLYAVALRRAWDSARRAKVVAAAPPDVAPPPPTPEEIAMAAAEPIPDERLRLVFTCCHPALDLPSRIALTLRVVCGFPPADIARAFLLTEPALAQRLARARRKIRDAGIGHDPPGPEHWPERIGGVLATLEIAYGEAHRDAALVGDHAEVGLEVLALTAALAAMLPNDAEVLALAALVRFAESRRAARVDQTGAMVPLDEQDVRLWDSALLHEAEALLARAAARAGAPGPYQLLAAIHAAHASRRHSGQTPWTAILRLYQALRTVRRGAVVAVNAAVALARAEGPLAGLAMLDSLQDEERLRAWLPWHAARADLLRRAGHPDAGDAYRRALSLAPTPAERLFLERQLGTISDQR